MQAKMLGRDFVNRICEALDITDPGVTGVRISADCRSGVKIEIEKMATVDEGLRLAEVLKDARADVKMVTVGGARDEWRCDAAFFGEALAKASAHCQAFDASRTVHMLSAGHVTRCGAFSRDTLFTHSRELVTCPACKRLLLGQTLRPVTLDAKRSVGMEHPSPAFACDPIADEIRRRLAAITVKAASDAGLITDAEANAQLAAINDEPQPELVNVRHE